ncbi:hypothetical protein EW146_g2673 [Bondarzewia mesenterica]|uniref:Uncharacterized protein n=1 Tax=Bondarzewia mesenterica TaxID=1095465 RepID=A0A4S4LZX1_9AGAM|nr:hypothetical protein EW146_g2673 [Bondarzewia mesenterica]
MQTNARPHIFDIRDILTVTRPRVLSKLPHYELRCRKSSGLLGPLHLARKYTTEVVPPVYLPVNKKRNRSIQSLDPRHLQPSDHTDISGLSYPRFYAISEKRSLQAFHVAYYVSSGSKVQFPRETPGFLYYKPSTTSVLLDGEIRFCVTKSSVTFAKGSDLLMPDGSVWKLEISRVLYYKGYGPLAHLLLKENPSLKSILPQTILAHLHRLVRALDPQHITASDFHDISGLLAASYTFELEGSDTSSERAHIRYESVKEKRLPFPSGTHGFLYYLSPHGDMTEGQIRFRITQDCKPSSFVGGRDLTFSSGLPWHLPLHLLRGSTTSGLLCLLSEDLVAKDTTPPTEDGTDIDVQLPRRRTANPVIMEFGQLFSLDFSKGKYTLWIKIGRQHLEIVRIVNPLASYRDSGWSSPYDGVALCCFEPSPRSASSRSNSRKRDKAVLRLVKITKPFVRKEHVRRSSAPMAAELEAAEQEAAEPPEEGQLFMSRGREREYFLKGSVLEASGATMRS